MNKTKKLGIWMDHSNAILLELANDSVNEESIVSESSSHDEEYSSERHEKMENNKEQHQQSGFYNKIGDKIRNYSDVILFGPTDAKSELLNLLRTDHLFSEIKIELHNSDKMTKNQMHEFVREYFR
jgi:stalled ribosome rescue protein Dom34